MSELIKRKDAIKLVKRAMEEGLIPTYYLGLAPTIEAVSVVRCKDCKHRQNQYAPKWCYEMSKETNADDFCSYGEREVE